MGAVEVEAQAFEIGILFAEEMGFQDFVLEGDSLIIVQVLCENSPASSLVASLIYGVLAASYEFDNVIFSHFVSKTISLLTF